jgi:hypothetical protein
LVRVRVWAASAPAVSAQCLSSYALMATSHS